ncbi:MAG: DNA polymerase III subunit beta [Gammaproteobacteria bacterium]|nr:DNA polymerase III subunit beta [Gammaproteobacteria bacterium]
MKFTVVREELLKPLQLVSGVVERRQTRPILANLLMVLTDDNVLSLTGTDEEIEILVKLKVSLVNEVGEITVSARKLVDICRSLPEHQKINFFIKDQTLILKSGRSRFNLSTLPASDFPATENIDSDLRFSASQSTIKELINSTAFCMAQQDVRYFLNGMLWEVENDTLRCVATDGHRLAMSSKSLNVNFPDKHQIILPRKGVTELSRLLDYKDEDVLFTLSNRYFRVETEEYTLTSKIMEGKFPDYEKVIPTNGKNIAIGDREELKQAFLRAAILSNEKHLGVRLVFSPHLLTIVSNNIEQEEAEETVAVEYEDEEIEIGFNIGYLQDVTSVIANERIKITLSDSNSSVLLEDPDNSDVLYVIMPMRL